MIQNKLKHFRHQKEMNQKEFAAFLEFDKSTYSLWERQERQPDWENAFKLKRKLGLKYLDDLMEEVPE